MLPISASLATVIVERVFDGLVMLVFVFVALPFVPLPDNASLDRNIVVWASIAFFVALVVFFDDCGTSRTLIVMADGELLDFSAATIARTPARCCRPLL